MVHLSKIRNWHCVPDFKSGTFFSLGDEPSSFSFLHPEIQWRVWILAVWPLQCQHSPPASLPCPPTQPFPTPIPLQRKPGQPRRNSYGARGSNSRAVSFLRPSHQVPLSTNPQRYLLPINIPLPANLFTNSTTDPCGTHPMPTPSSKLSIKLNSTNIYW